jgi:mannose-6-phosphate isomerase-like protein (cupin superfamily)
MVFLGPDAARSGVPHARPPHDRGRPHDDRPHLPEKGNEQITYILEGALRFHIGEDQKQEVIVRAGEVLHIPTNVPHMAEALEDTLDVDVFDPPRQDWIDKTDAYLRK